MKSRSRELRKVTSEIKARSLSKIGPLTGKEPKKIRSTNVSMKNANKTGPVGESTLHHRGRVNLEKRSRLKFAPRVFGRSNNFGNSYGDTEAKDSEFESINVTDSEIEMFDEKEFRNKERHYKSPKGPSIKQEIIELQSESDDGTDIEIETIDESQFRNKKMQEWNEVQSGAVPGENGSRKKKISHVNLQASFIRSDESQFRNKKMQELNGVQSGAVPGKNGSRKKKVSYVNLHASFIRGDASDDSYEGRLHKSTSFVEEGDGLGFLFSGDDNENVNAEETTIGRMDKAEFKQKSYSVSKIGPSKRHGLDEGYFATASKKIIDSLSKQIPFVDSSNQRQLNKSSPSMQRENNLLRRSEFTSKKMHSRSKIGPSTRQIRNEGSSAATIKKNDISTTKKAHRETLILGKPQTPFVHQQIPDRFPFRRGLCPPGDACQYKSNSRGKRGNNSDACYKEIKIELNDEAEFISEKTPFASKKAPLTGNDSCEKEVANIVKEVANSAQSFSYEDAGSHSDCGMGQTDLSNSFAEEGNSEEDTDSDRSFVQKNYEAEFRNKGTYFVSKIESSSKKELNEEYFAAISGGNRNSVSKKVFSAEKFDGNRKKKRVSAYSRRKRNKEQWNRNVSDDVYTSSTDWVSCNLCMHCNRNMRISDSINASQRDNKISSNGAEHDTNPCIASRTRSKIQVSSEQAPEVDHGIMDSSHDADSFTDTVFDSSNGDDSGAGRLNNSDKKELLESHVEKYDAQNEKLMEVPAEEIEDCSREKGIRVKRSTKKRRFSDYQYEEKDYNQPAVPKRKFSSRNKRLSNNASNKQTKGQETLKTNEVREENGENNKKLDNNDNSEECFQEKSDGKNEKCYHSDDDNQPAVPKRKFSLRKKQLSNNASSKQTEGPEETLKTNEVGEENGEINKNLDNNDNSEECFQEKSDDGKNEKCHHSDDDNQTPFDSTGSDSHVTCETEKITAADEIENPTKRKKVAAKHYDFCKMLADYVLKKGPMLGTMESDEQAEQVPVSPIKITLPKKFRFEDEVPKEVEKTESELEMEDLYAELNFSLAVVQKDSFSNPKVDEETESELADETQHARCLRGKHELESRDDEGLICIYCRHVELEPKYIMPQWAPNSHRGSKKKRHPDNEQLLEFEEFHSQSSMGNVVDFRNCPNGTVWNIKPGIRESMYEHQQEGFEFLWKNLAGSIYLNELNSTDPGGVGGCIISHAPGTGKTRLTIVFIETYLQLFPNCRPVIIAPASMLLTWEEEFRKWNVDFPFYNINSLEFSGKENENAVKLFVGSKRRNKDAIRMVKIFSWNSGRSILGISYSLFEKLTGEKYIKGETGEKREESVNIDDNTKAMRKILLEKPGLVILDEGHTPRNKRSNIWNALLKLHTEKRVVLSGTPFQNNFEELFNMLRIVRPAIANVLVRERTYADMITPKRKYKGRNRQSTSLSEVTDYSVEKLKNSMSPFVHVHKGTILQQSLPGLKDCVVLMKPSPLQKSLIERLEGSPSTFEFEHKVALISVHPYLFKYCDSTEEQKLGIDLNAVKASKLNPNLGAKTKFIIELVRYSMALKEKVLIFSQYIQPIQLLKEQLKETFNWVAGKEILQMEGKLDQKHRQFLINVFNDPLNESKVMLASTKCCSEGISLVGASRVVLLDVVWNPSVERQAICRAYRIGQKKVVYTYRLMTSGTTEADKYCRQAEKERLSELVFTSSSNESNKEKYPYRGIEDRILEEMVNDATLKEMFEKIINQPKDTDLIQTFGLISS